MVAAKHSPAAQQGACRCAPPRANLAQTGLEEPFPGAEPPFPRMSEIIAPRQEKNVFATRVTEYQLGGAPS
ncbi:hypothetical protein [Halomonas maura]|uniref:hypothetical protein n=1 Tax=Halomonas maura TaxID=117606 RepID=UPI003F494453